MRNYAYKIGICICVATKVAYSVDYTNSTLPSNISLNGGQRQDTITSIKSPQGWQMTTIGLNRNPHLSINGTATSQYTLQVRDDTTTFYSGGFSIGSGVEATLMSIHTLAIESGSVSVSSGASFRVISSGNTINAQGSEYGGESKVRFARGTSLNLAQNARADFSNANFFIHDGSTAISQGANLTISATKAIRFQNEFINNGGSVNLTGSVYNVGSPVGVRNDNTTSTFTINGGNVSITGDFYNGIESKDMSVDNTGSVAGGFNIQDSAFGGGGNLTINGGNMSVSGTLISQMGGDSINGGGISNPRNSSISIYGGTLSATGGVQNKSGSTLTFGIKNGVMGKIAGNLTNNGGNVVIDFANASDGQTYQFVTGSISGANTISYINADFANITPNGGSVTYNLDTQKINTFMQSLIGNERGIFEISKAIMGNNIYSSASGAQIKQYMQQTNQSINDIINIPFSVFTSLKSANTHFLYSKNSAQENLSVGFVSSKFSAGKFGENVGTLFGLQAACNLFSGVISVAYGKASLEHSNSAQSVIHTSHNIMLRFTQAFDISQSVKFYVGASYFSSFGTLSRNNYFVQSNTNASQDLNALLIDAQVLKILRVKENIEITPYVGLNHYVYSIEPFKENISNALKMQTNRFYALGLGFGIMGKYIANNYQLFGKVDYEIINVENRNVEVLYGTQNLTYSLPLHNTLNAVLGGSVALRNNTFIDMSGFFANYGINNAIGLNVSLRKEF